MLRINLESHQMSHFLGSLYTVELESQGGPWIAFDNCRRYSSSYVPADSVVYLKLVTMPSYPPFAFGKCRWCNSSCHIYHLTIGGGLNQHLQNYKWNPLWLYMRLWDVKRFFEIFSVLTLHRPPQISEKWGKMAHFGRFPTFSYWLVWSLNY